MTQGIHHITAIASDASVTYEFYTKVLGLRLVKKTVNQDDVNTYHLFFGDTQGNPGIDVTFFVFQPSVQGESGTGQVSTVSFAIPESSLAFWQDRLHTNSINYAVDTIFEKKRIIFSDPDGLQLELVATTTASDSTNDVWLSEGITVEQAIRHFYSARLSVVNKQSIEIILQHVFGYSLEAEHETLLQYATSNTDKAAKLELSVEQADQGLSGAGTVHHIAFRAHDELQQLTMRNKVLELGLYPTPVIDRFYFKSVYFRTPAGILFEIATDGPGFIADESEKSLGTRLALPPFLESRRAEIEAGLPPLVVP